jgi:hypothetical protein
MDDVPDRRVWLTRLRWRLRGSTQWPAWWLATLAEALVEQALPISGDRSVNVVGMFLLCGFANLAIVAVLGPLGGRLLRRRREDLPRAVAADRAATLALAAGVVVFVAVGLGHRGAVRDADRNARAQLAAARAWFGRNAPARYRVNLGREDVWKQADDLFRTCLPGPDPQRELCVFVDLSGPAPAVTRDPDQRPNGEVAGPGAPGLSRGG